MTVDNVFDYSISEGFLWSEVNLKGEKKYYVEGYASTIDEDKAGEIIDLSAQQDICDQLQGTNITMDIEHDQWYSDDGKVLPRPKNEKIPVAKIIHAEMRPRGTWIKAEINTNLYSFKQVWGSIKDGFLKAFSVAFYPVQKAGNTISRLNLVNVTLTGSPVNPNATFAVSMKSARAWLDSQEELKAVTKPSQSLDNPDKPITKGGDETMESEEKKKKTPEEEEEEEKKKKKKESEPEVKAEEIVVDVKAEHEAELKALNDKLEAAIKAHSEEVAALKAELEKPQLKAVVETAMPKEAPMMRIVSPLNLIK